MRYLFFIILCTPLCLLSQESIKLKLIDSTHLVAETVFNVDSYTAIYFTDTNGSFNKKTKDATVSYANFQLGKITSANAFNPLKINLFYSDFNTVIILDNRLAEVKKINFNNSTIYKNVSHISTGYDNTIWIFNQDLQILELFDYKNNITRVKTLPLQSQPIALKSNYNYCYLLTEDFLYIYNYFGSLLSKVKNNGYTNMAFSNSNLVLLADKELILLTKNGTKTQTIETLDLMPNQFLVTNETLYIYKDKKLRHYQLKLQ